MKITLTDVKFFQSRSGNGMRCSLSLSAPNPKYGVCTQTTTGCLVFRDRHGKLSVLTPIIYLGPARVRHRPITLSPGLMEWLRDEIERMHGHNIQRHPKRETDSMIPASQLGLPDSIELDTEEVA